MKNNRGLVEKRKYAKNFSINIEKLVRKKVKMNFDVNTRAQYFYTITLIVHFMLLSSMVRVQKRIQVGMGVLQYFTTRKWTFINSQTTGLTNKMSEKEQQIFYIGNVKVESHQYLKDVLLGARQYCMKEPLSTLPKARFQLKL